LWQTYTVLNVLETVFKRLQRELGLRPVFHSKELRLDGHLFVPLLACPCVQVLRTQLKAAAINESWAGLRQTLIRQQSRRLHGACEKGNRCRARCARYLQGARHRSRSGRDDEAD
jgi:transposase